MQAIVSSAGGSESQGSDGSLKQPPGREGPLWQVCPAQNGKRQAESPVQSRAFPLGKSRDRWGIRGGQSSGISHIKTNGCMARWWRWWRSMFCSSDLSEYST